MKETLICNSWTDGFNRINRLTYLNKTNTMNRKTAMYEICILLHLILSKMRNFSKVAIFILYNKSKLIWKGDIDVRKIDESKRPFFETHGEKGMTYFVHG